MMKTDQLQKCEWQQIGDNTITEENFVYRRVQRMSTSIAVEIVVFLGYHWQPKILIFFTSTESQIDDL